MLLSKSLDKFDEDSKKRFDNILQTNESLFKAYYLKEDIGQIWMQENKDEAEKQNWNIGAQEIKRQNLQQW